MVNQLKEEDFPKLSVGVDCPPKQEKNENLFFHSLEWMNKNLFKKYLPSLFKSSSSRLDKDEEDPSMIEDVAKDVYDEEEKTEANTDVTKIDVYDEEEKTEANTDVTKKDVDDEEEKKTEENADVTEINPGSSIITQILSKVLVVVVLFDIIPNGATAANSYTGNQTNSSMVTTTRFPTPFADFITCQKSIIISSKDCTDTLSCIFDRNDQLWLVCSPNIFMPKTSCPVLTIRNLNARVEVIPEECPNCPPEFNTLKKRANAGEECFRPISTTTKITTGTTTTPPPTTNGSQNKSTRMGPTVMMLPVLCALVIFLCRHT